MAHFKLQGIKMQGKMLTDGFIGANDGNRYNLKCKKFRQ